MRRIICSSCGAGEFKESDGYKICDYCGARYKSSNASTIVLGDDISRLLKKCRDEPQNSRKYANLILDIDPTNKEALNILK